MPSVPLNAPLRQDASICALRDEAFPTGRCSRVRAMLGAAGCLGHQVSRIRRSLYPCFGGHFVRRGARESTSLPNSRGEHASGQACGLLAFVLQPV